MSLTNNSRCSDGPTARDAFIADRNELLLITGAERICWSLGGAEPAQSGFRNLALFRPALTSDLA